VKAARRDIINFLVSTPMNADVCSLEQNFGSNFIACTDIPGCGGPLTCNTDSDSTCKSCIDGYYGNFGTSLPATECIGIFWKYFLFC
jgi:hypothetical protein